MKVIALVGKATSGKDTVADIIQDLLGDAVLRRSFASPVKSLARLYFKWDGKKDQKGRQLLMDIGMTGRRYNQDLWLDQTKEYLHVFSHTAEVAVVPDCRFVNEYDWAMSNGVTIRVIRDDVELIDHVSETELDGFLTSSVIVNNGTVDDLKTEVERELKRLGICE